jgi:hypothetical protein
MILTPFFYRSVKDLKWQKPLTFQNLNSQEKHK